MRRIRVGVKTIAVMLSVMLCVLVVYALLRRPVFEGGTSYELYCGTSSAEIILTENPALTKLLRFDVRGESARYEGDMSAELMSKYAAELRFTEEAAGVINYYLYSKKLPAGILLNGREINLHIAVSETQTVAGTPIIFGGF